MTTLSVLITEDKVTSQSIARATKATVGTAEVTAEVSMTNSVVSAYSGGQIKEGDVVKANFNQYAGGRMQITADVDYLSQAQAILAPFMAKMDAVALTMTEQPASAVE